jgi:hypothetical protein
MSDRKTEELMVYRRFPGYAARDIDGEIFLINNQLDRINALDTTSSAIWRLLETPHSLHDCLEIFSAAYPDMKKARRTKIVTTAMQNLEKAGLVYKTPPKVTAAA